MLHVSRASPSPRRQRHQKTAGLSVVLQSKLQLLIRKHPTHAYRQLWALFALSFGDNAHSMKGSPPLMWAARFNRNREVFTVLQNTGADARGISSAGETIPEYAQKNEHLKSPNRYRQLQQSSREA